MKQIVVLGGGVAGLFTAYYLAKEGASVMLVEKEELGAGSVHAAGLIEPQTVYQINTISYLRDALQFAKRGVLTIKSVDGNWALCYLRALASPKSEDPSLFEMLRSMSQFSLCEYRRLAQEDREWSYQEKGLLELYEEKNSFEEALSEHKKRGTQYEVVEKEGYAGGIFFKEVGSVCTELFVQRMAKELSNVEILKAKAERVELDGSIQVSGRTLKPEVVVAAMGVECRKLGVPVTAVKGVGHRVSSPKKLDTPVIVYERSLALVSFDDWTKITSGLGFDFSPTSEDSQLDYAKGFLGELKLIDSKVGFRPCSPDGLPIIGRKQNVVVVTGGFRLGWSLAPAMGRYAADLALGRVKEYPYISRYVKGTHSAYLK